ncbi:hypothetical protein L486_04352 [Kwoniella mangroviensis CBS 10435]|uniref:RING-type E3 ubiquitin transferase n=1 Tax=Kwoniella mangroviensis CBS 10435 TaxID=1331196 RepID=A0A1B9IS24_9TREE|nr:hypothetical protein L486_04352 [Kwoniella mangroviensis CBS 10435]OCF78329.1 hypothetical protein I204_00267 [Kwoniella mangroviensis CBS 8886]
MDQPVASSSRRSSIIHQEEEDHSTRLTLENASQAQIIRAHQRDSSTIYQLTELVSEITRNIAGTRWLAQKQSIIDILVKVLYLSLTFGRGYSTLGEEYTDILPFHLRRGRLPSKKRRIISIIFLLLPSMIFSPMITNYLRTTTSNEEQPQQTRLEKVKRRLISLIDSPFGRIVPEMHMILFLFRGKFFELARRLTGLSYVSTLPPKPIERRATSYEPLGLLMLLPFLYRLSIQLRSSISSSSTSSSEESPKPQGHLPIPTPYKDDILPLSPPLTPPLTAQQTILLESHNTAKYDEANTYLTPDALDLPERQCTLCLESRGTGEGSGGTTAVTECGHVFCWGCLGGLEKLECPLCRQSLRMERLVAAYNL